eukprot:maker-scaffold198_size266703-snap-gene-0.22 protein:Tk12337 transcript:maker-scaffold198_size266703-snap-gene-0.22-mRNA-1 annotation:"gamma-tubulin complex component 6"
MTDSAARPEVPRGLWADVGRLTVHLGAQPGLRAAAMAHLLRGSRSDETAPSQMSAWDEVEAAAFALQQRGHPQRAEQTRQAQRQLRSLASAQAGEAGEAGEVGEAVVLRLLARLARVPRRSEAELLRSDDLWPWTSTLGAPELVPAPAATPRTEDRPFYDPASVHSLARPYPVAVVPPLTSQPRLDPLSRPYGRPEPADRLFETPGAGLTFFHFRAEAAPLTRVPPLALSLDPRGQRPLRLPRPGSARVLSARGGRAGSPSDDGYDSLSEGPPDPSAVWDHVLGADGGGRRTWETGGRAQAEPERPYLSQLGPAAVHPAWLWAMANLQLVHPKVSIPPLHIVSEAQLRSDIGYLMIGIESQTFEFVVDPARFQIRAAGLTIHGLTPEAVASACRDVLTSGSLCRRLEQLTQPSSSPLGPHVSPGIGLIFEGFRRGIGQYLQGYRNTVLNLVRRQRRFLELAGALRPLSVQIQFLGRLCQLDDTATDTLPMGIQLLCYLFDRTLHINTKDLYFVLVSLLKQSAQPYFRFLEQWIFHGVCHDEFSEFGIVANAPLMASRSRIFWTNGHTVAEMPLDSSICGGGNFISHIQQQVYVCGKSMNLLKLCSPNHHLCSPMVRDQPAIQLLVTPIEQSTLKKRCGVYIETMREIAKEKTLSLQKQEELELAAQKELLQVARRRRKEKLDKISEHRKSILEAEDRRKRLAFEQLKGQMLEERRRKVAEKELKREQDRKWTDLALKREEEDVEREKRIRAEQEAMFQMRLEEATRRDVRNDWRTRRMELKSHRILFWRKENKKTQIELKRVAEEEAQKAQEATTASWKRINIKEDEQRNIILVLEDEESNVSTEIIGNISEFSDEMQKSLLTQEFNSLPLWVREKCLTNLRGHEAEDSLNANSNSAFTRRTNLNASGKRKRPDSFLESIEKKMELDDTISPLVTFRQPKHPSNESQPYISLSSALSKDDPNGNFAKPLELSMIDGRKRPTSKSIEEILYPSRFKSSSDQGPITPSRTQFDIEANLKVRPYPKVFPHLGDREVQIFTAYLKTEPDQKQIDPQAFTPLSMLMENSILIPLRAQVKVVNESILNYMLVEAKLMDELKALRNYILLHDGEFAQHLARSIFTEVSEAKSASEILNPVTLNRIVENSLMASNSGKSDAMAQNVGFTFDDYNEAKDILDCIKLGYRTSWPTNIILTPETINMYGDVFKFLLQLRKAAWGLEQVFFDLKHLRGLEHCSQIRQIHLMRHEMLNFVTITQDYVTTQVLDVSWEEFGNSIRDQVKSMDSLHEAHMKYLNKILFRCILNKKAKPVQKIIIDIFNIVVKFSLLLTSQSWILEGGEAKHPAYLQVQEAYRVFQEYSKFLYTVVQKLAVRGYEHHLYDLLLCLNFNSYYDRKNNANSSQILT